MSFPIASTTPTSRFGSPVQGPLESPIGEACCSGELVYPHLFGEVVLVRAVREGCTSPAALKITCPDGALSKAVSLLAGHAVDQLKDDTTGQALTLGFTSGSNDLLLTGSSATTLVQVFQRTAGCRKAEQQKLIPQKPTAQPKEQVSSASSSSAQAQAKSQD
jgi:hypothetical protein